MNTKYMVEFGLINKINNLAEGVGNRILSPIEHNSHIEAKQAEHAVDGAYNRHRNLLEKRISELHLDLEPTVTPDQLEQAEKEFQDAQAQHLKSTVKYINMRRDLDPSIKRALGYGTAATGVVGAGVIGRATLGGNSNNNNILPSNSYNQPNMINPDTAYVNNNINNNNQARYSNYMIDIANFGGLGNLGKAAVDAFIDKPVSNIADTLANTGNKVINKVVDIPASIERGKLDPNSLGNRFKRFVNTTATNVKEAPGKAIRYLDEQADKAAKNLNNLDVIKETIDIPHKTVESVKSIIDTRRAKQLEAEANQQLQSINNLFTKDNALKVGAAGALGIGGLGVAKSALNNNNNNNNKYN
jgi:hypothetical protein